MEQVQGERSDGWEGAREGRSNGWPLGLQRLNGRLSIASTSTFLISTPSLTSFSSSDFDTESTGSFFPERSTTLGSLIGFESSSQMEIDSLEEEQTTRNSTNGHNRSRTWWSLLSCGSRIRDNSLDISPSLAHFLEKERRESHSQRSSNSIREHQTHEEQRQEQEERLHSNGADSHRNEHSDNEGMIVSRPCGPTLRFILQQPSPSDWNEYSKLSCHHQIREDRFRRCYTLCGRLNTCKAN